MYKICARLDVTKDATDYITTQKILKSNSTYDFLCKLVAPAW